ncbi:hypothetical protein JW960_28515 [candidate division KSB1 bacterium]|nr:hypothetical protein [candidate division KSB1 bacterium]
MDESASTGKSEQVFDPLRIMGIFWAAFGTIVLSATAFIRVTPRVPLFQGVVTNLIAGGILLAAGVLCLLKAKSNKQKESTKS